MRRLGVAVLFALLAVAVLVLLACSAEQSEPPSSGEVTGTTTPPGTENPAQARNAVIGEEVLVGDWTVVVREAEFETEDGQAEDRGGESETDRPPGSVETTPPQPTVLKVEVGLSHDAEEPLTVRRNDWALDDGSGGIYTPVAFEGDTSNKAERSIPPGQTEDVELQFQLPSEHGAYLLRFEPIEGGPGVLQVAIP